MVGASALPIDWAGAVGHIRQPLYGRGLRMTLAKLRIIPAGDRWPRRPLPRSE